MVGRSHLAGLPEFAAKWEWRWSDSRSAICFPISKSHVTLRERPVKMTGLSLRLKLVGNPGSELVPRL